MKSPCKNNTGTSIYLNGKKVADTIQTDATIYPSGMLVARVIPSESEESTGSLGYTKHYYAGTQRVSSKIGTTENLGDFLQDWITQGLGGPVDAIGSSMDVLTNAEEGVVQVYTELGIEPPTYESSPTFIPVPSFVHGVGAEKEIYWFHPDHLGSTSYITNLFGEVSQHMEYFAFGETFVEEHRSSNNSPYKFNGKELDEDTQWYYYGARYYDPRISLFISYDPMGESTMTPYQYTYQNPINLTDPTGMAPDQIDPTEFNKTADEKNRTAMQFFVSTKEGYDFFAKYAKAGDEIGGVKFDKDGEYHKLGINIKVGTKVGEPGASGTANDTLTDDGLDFELNIGNGSREVSFALETIGHESFIHILPRSIDYQDDGKLNFSDGFDEDAMTFIKSQGFYMNQGENVLGWMDHFSEKASHHARENYIAPILKQYFQKNKINVSNEKINNGIDNFSFGHGFQFPNSKYGEYLQNRNKK